MEAKGTEKNYKRHAHIKSISEAVILMKRNIKVIFSFLISSQYERKAEKSEIRIFLFEEKIGFLISEEGPFSRLCNEHIHSLI